MAQSTSSDSLGRAEYYQTKQRGRVTQSRELARFCRLLPHLRRQAEVEGWLGELHHVLGRVRDDPGCAEAVLKPFWITIGISPSADRTVFDLPGVAAHAPPQGGYICPQRHCTRVEQRDPGGPIPTCELFGTHLRFGA
jgi:hypothetical protein